MDTNIENYSEINGDLDIFDSYQIGYFELRKFKSKKTLNKWKFNN